MLYNIYSICVIVFSTISVVFGYFFLRLSVFNDQSLHNYSAFRKYLGYAYFVLAALNIAELFLRKISTYASIITFIILFTASLQAFLVTYALITLININFNKQHPAFRELVPIIFFLFLCFLSFVFNFTDSTRNIINIFFGGYYLFQLCHYTIMFLSERRVFHSKMDNFYSDLEIKKIHWISVSFYIALMIAIFVPVTLYLKSYIFLIINVILCIFFYTFFGVKYLNYIYVFYLIRPAMIEEKKEEKILSPLHKDEIAGEIDEWVRNKGFTESKININDVANLLHTNRTYLSSYINSNKDMNFNTWINFLRVEEAKSLLAKQPYLSLNEISDKVGYCDQSSFGRHFSSLTGYTPLSWRKKYSTDK